MHKVYNTPLCALVQKISLILYRISPLLYKKFEQATNVAVKNPSLLPNYRPICESPMARGRALIVRMPLKTKNRRSPFLWVVGCVYSRQFLRSGVGAPGAASQKKTSYRKYGPATMFSSSTHPIRLKFGMHLLPASASKSVGATLSGKNRKKGPLPVRARLVLRFLRFLANCATTTGVKNFPEILVPGAEFCALQKSSADTPLYLASRPSS